MRFGTSAGASQFQITTSGVNVTGNFSVTGTITSKYPYFSGTSFTATAANSGSFSRVGSGGTFTLPSVAGNQGIWFLIENNSGGNAYIGSGAASIYGALFTGAGVMSFKNAPNMNSTTIHAVTKLVCDGSGWIVEYSFGWV